jgi:hypothetical protein
MDGVTLMAGPGTGEAAFLGVLATSVPGHAVAYFGLPRASVVAGLLSSLDITSKLLVAVESGSDAERLREEAPGDLRLSVHAQTLGSLFDDIAVHQFGLVLVERLDVALTARAAGLVAPGGWCVGLGSTPLPDDIEAGEFVHWVPAGDEAAWVMTRRARPTPQRRGGRAGKRRQSVMQGANDGA